MELSAPWLRGFYGGGYGGGGYANGAYVEPVQAAQAYAGPGVSIRNPTQHPVNFTLDGSRQMIVQPGETLRLTDYADYQISFDRGDQLGTATYTIYEGFYEFAQTDRGWELYRQKNDAQMDAGPAPADIPAPLRAEPPPPPMPANPE